VVCRHLTHEPLVCGPPPTHRTSQGVSKQVEDGRTLTRVSHLRDNPARGSGKLAEFSRCDR